MKMRTKMTLRKTISMILSFCIICSMVAAAAADEPDSTNPYYQSFTGGETDNSHDAEHDPLGNLVLPEEFEEPEGYHDFGAIVLNFSDGQGGGTVSVKTGDLTSAGKKYETEISWEYGNYKKEEDGHGAVILMNDSSTLNMDTGAISSQGSGINIKMNESSELNLNVDGTISAGNDGINVNNIGNSNAQITAQDITTGGSGIYIKNRDDSDINITVNNIKTEESCVIGIGNEYGSDVQMKVNGTVSGGYGVSIYNSYDSDVKLETGGIDTDDTGISAYLYDGSDADIRVNGDIHTDSGYGIMSQTDGGSNVKVNVAGSVTTEDGIGLDLTLSAFDPDEMRQEADITIGGSLQSSDQAIYIHNNVNGHVKINIGADETIENAGTITATDADAIFLNTIAGSSIEINGGDVYGSGDYANIRANAEGDNSSITINVGNVTGSGSAEGVSATAGHADSQVEINTGNIVSGGYGINVSADSRYDYGNAENGSCYGSGGILTINTGTVNGGSGIAATADGGILTVNTGAVECSESGVGVSVSTVGTDPKQGAKVTVDGSVTGAETGISVGSSGESGRILNYENNNTILINPDDPHENWWEKMRIDETGYYVLVPVDTENGITWQKYLWYGEDHPQHADYSEEDISNYQSFDDVFGWIDWEEVEVSTQSANYAQISTGAVEAGLYGILANNHGGDFTVRVGGDVTVAGAESYKDDWNGYTYYNNAQGITANSTSGTTSIVIDGGLSVYSIEQESAAAVNPDGEEDGETDDEAAVPEGRYTGNGVTIGNYGGEIDISINGDLNAEEGTAVAIQQEYWWEPEANNGEAVLNIAGDVNAENGIDVGINGNGSGHVQINIGGDLNTSGTGLILGQEENQSEWDWEEADEDHAEETDGTGATENNTETAGRADPAVDIIVQETISGTVPIFVENALAAMNFLITTWAVRPNEDNQITVDQEGNSVQEVEENINYIIKKEENNKYGILNVSGTTEKSYPSEDNGEGNTQGSEGDRGQDIRQNQTLNVAKQDHELTLSVDLKDEYKTGYAVVIYNGKGDNKLKADVTKQEDGSFLFCVPWAGGVYLSFDLEKLPVPDSDPDPDPDPNPDPDQDPDTDPDADNDPDTDPDSDSDQDPDPEPDPDPEDEPEQPEESEQDPQEPEKDKEKGHGKGRVLAIIYGEEESYTIWFLPGYRYRALFKDQYEENGSYRIENEQLILTEKNGDERTIDSNWNMGFDEKRIAEYIKADFSDSVRIIGEFNQDDEGKLEITDKELKPLQISSIRGYIDNPYALEILEAVLHESAE